MKKKMTPAILALGLFFLAGGLPLSAAILMIPYLQAVTADSIWVLVESSSADPVVTVEFGPTIDYGQTAKTKAIKTTNESTFVHRIKLSGLSAKSLYHYRAIQGTDKTDDSTFSTAVPAGMPFRFAWMADFRTGVAIHDLIAKRVAAAEPVVLLYGGDLAFNSKYNSFKNEFFRPNELALISRISFFNTPGNHEGWGSNTRAFTQAPASASNTEDFFSFDYGDMHVLVLNTELDYGPESAQYAFAEKDISTTERIWKVVVAHKPAYCAGGHGGEDDLKVMTTKIFEKYKVDLFIAGHNHFYQHNLVNGIHHLVIGSAGAPLYNVGSAPYTLKSVKDYNYAVGDVSPTALKLVVYNATGTVLDEINLEKPQH